jgi:ParB family transcriptional regulator, chromosome partitioning protein
MPDLPQHPVLPRPGGAQAVSRGHIELERRLDSITVGIRHRTDFGDIDALARSIKEVGLLQPITITPDGVLVCGMRRLEAVRRLGWPTLKVWVRSGISDELSHLLAQQDENEQRKPLTPLETEALYREVKKLVGEEAEQRQAATRFGGTGSAAGVNGAEGHTAPRGNGDARVQASRLITGNQSWSRLEQIGWLKDIAADGSQSTHVRQFATNALAAIDDGAPVEPAYKRVKAAVELASKPQDTDPDSDDELGRLAAEALARVQQAKARSGVRALKRKPESIPQYRSLRSFILTWTELEGWSALYSVDEIAASLRDDEWERFERVITESVQFADLVRQARQTSSSFA